MTAVNSANIAAHLVRAATEFPQTFAVFSPQGTDYAGRTSYAHYTFEQLEEESNIFARGLAEAGIRSGMRVVFLVKPGLDFFALAFALFKLGAVIVGVDPGMGPKNVARCLAESEPEAFIGVPAAHAARRVFGWGRNTVRINIVVGRRNFVSRRFYNWGLLGRDATDLPRLRTAGLAASPSDTPVTLTDTPAALVFTSGSTGLPKGVVYTHGTFNEQARVLAETFQIRAGERELITFPHFAFFGPAWGSTLVVADMDFMRPAVADPAKLVAAIKNFGVTGMFGSPALLDRLGRWGEQTGVHLPTLERVISAGAPVSPRVLRRITGMLRRGVQVHTPYGATEALPVSSIGSDELLGETTAATEKGAGVCVGRPLADLSLQIIKITDEPIERWSEELLVEPGQIGEIVVRGSVVTQAYYRRPESNLLAKIRAADCGFEGGFEGGFYHRMGDLGYVDSLNRLWFCGRKSQRVVTPAGDYYTVPCEAIFNTHPNVFRSALVAVNKDGSRQPALCVELENTGQAINQAEVRRQLFQTAAQFQQTQGIRDIFFHPAFPVDARHNAKIGREKLSQWAQQQLRSQRS